MEEQWVLQTHVNVILYFQIIIVVIPILKAYIITSKRKGRNLIGPMTKALTQTHSE